MRRILLLIVLLGLLPACCPSQKPRDTLPAPISLQEQVRRLSEHAHALPRLRATIGPLGAHLEYPDESGRMQSHHAEGDLLLQQHFDAERGSPESWGDVYLSGKILVDTKVFEAGRNASIWWFAIFLDRNTVRTGDASRPIDVAGMADPDSAGIIRADLIFDLLGLSELPPIHNLIRQNDEIKYQLSIPGLNKAILLRVDDVAGTNVLMIEEFTAGGALYLSHEIVIDRFTGNVTEVRLYNPAGVLVVRSQLDNYQPVKYEDVEKANPVPQFPMQVTVSYPSQKTTVQLKFNEVTVRGEFPPGAFRSPDMTRLKVISNN